MKSLKEKGNVGHHENTKPSTDQIDVGEESRAKSMDHILKRIIKEDPN